MQLEFNVETAKAVYRRNWFTGRASLAVDGKEISIQNPWTPATHFSVQPSRTWVVTVDHHRISIEKERPLLLAGLRPQVYKIKVDGQLVAQHTGY